MCMGRVAHLRAVPDPSSSPPVRRRDDNRAVRAALVVLAALAFAAPAGARLDVGSPLETKLAKALAVPHVDPARSAAFAVDLRTGAVVFSHNADLPLLPASNEKLPVAYAALTLLGPWYRFHTEVGAVGALEDGVLRGDLVLRGYGDPTLTAKDLDALAEQVAAWGIRRVTGGVVGDESWFDARRVGPGWKPSYYLDESPPLSALVVERGWYRGRQSRSPALAAASLFRRALAAAGVRVERPSRVGTVREAALPLASDDSAPLREIVRGMGRESDNFVAEVLLKQLGRLYADAGTTAAGGRVLRGALAAAGVPLVGVRLVDGSGLSRLDRLTARSLVALLVAAWRDRDVGEPFAASLAVAGVDGTLEERMGRAPARGRVIAKTGTTNRACALSGYVRDRFAFAVIQNGRPVSCRWARRAQDRFATVLAARR